MYSKPLRSAVMKIWMEFMKKFFISSTDPIFMSGTLHLVWRILIEMVSLMMMIYSPMMELTGKILMAMELETIPTTMMMAMELLTSWMRFH